MRAPDVALIRARARAPLRDLQALHLSSAGIECVRHLETSCRALRSLYVDENRIRDLEGLLSLRRLWRIDLNGNRLGGVHADERLLSPLTSFAALGFLLLERNQLTFQDLVCLRDVHIMDLRVLEGNPALVRASGGSEAAYRKKTIALLPNVWVLDGHYVGMTEREQALDECDAFVQSLLVEMSSGGGGDGSACDQFGSTAKLWGGVVSEDGVGGDQNENAVRLIEHIDTDRVRDAEVEDRRRLRMIVSLHNDECAVHNTHCRFAPSKFSPNARVMPRIPLQELLAVSRSTRVEVAATLASYLEFGFARELLVEALVIQLLDCAGASAEELARLPPYAMTALLCITRHHALAENTEQASDADHERTLWTSMAPFCTSLLCHSKDARRESSDPSFAARCAFVVGLLSRAASFPDRFQDLRFKRRGAADTTAQLLQLMQVAKSSITSFTPAAADTNSTRRKPRISEWIEIRPKQFLKIQQVSEDGTHVVAYSATATSTSIPIPIDNMVRISSSMWRLDECATSQLRIGAELARSQSSLGKLGKLHRDSEGFHRHGAARSQGFPNHFVTSRDLREMQRLASDNQQTLTRGGLSAQLAHPVALFSSNDTIDANFVLASPHLVSAQNYCAVRNFQELGQSPAGLWSPIKHASFALVEAASDAQAVSCDEKPMNAASDRKSLAVLKAAREPEMRADCAQFEMKYEDGWALLQREMKGVLRIKPRQATHSLLMTQEQRSVQPQDDVRCFLTSLPPPTLDECSSASTKTSEDCNGEADDSDLLLVDTGVSPDTTVSTLAQARDAVNCASSAARSTPGPASLPAKTRRAAGSVSWHHVSTKPQLLVSSNSTPALGRSAHHQQAHVSLASRLQAPQLQRHQHQHQHHEASPHTTAPEAPRTLSAGRAPMKMFECHVVLPSLAQK